MLLLAAAAAAGMPAMRKPGGCSMTGWQLRVLQQHGLQGHQLQAPQLQVSY
jgi:hypothetical protein